MFFSQPLIGQGQLHRPDKLMFIYPESIGFVSLGVGHLHEEDLILHEQGRRVL